MEMPLFFLWLDPYLIWFFRLTEAAALNFLIGTAVMAGLALAVGKLGAALVLTIGRRYALELVHEAKKYQDLSHQALQAGDRPAYEAANRLANEAFSKSFFLGLAQSAAYVWPLALVLAWMQYRFLGLPFPIPWIGWSVSYAGIFIVLYLALWWLLKLLQRGAAFITGKFCPLILPPANFPVKNNQVNQVSAGNPSE